MEDFRKHLMTQSDYLFPVSQKPASTSASSAGSVISVSSAESSPVVSQTAKKGSSKVIVDLDDDDEVQLVSTAKEAFAGSAPKPHPTTKRLVWEDDDDDVVVARPFPLMSKPVNKPTPPTDLSSVFTKPPVKITAPSMSNMPPLKETTGPLWETFEEPEVGHLYDPMMSALETEKHLKELVEQSMNDTSSDSVDMARAVVDGFRDNIRLMPHQVIGREWMAERESGKKTGGILADDMGLGKTIQTLTRIVDNRPKKSDEKRGFAASTLVVCPVSLVSQWAKEIHNMAVGIRVVEHHGPNRTRDPEVLRRAHVVITSYSIVASEHGTFTSNQETKDESKSKSKSKGKNASSDDDEDELDDSDSDDSLVMAPKKKKRAPAAKAGKKKKPSMDALFKLNWWRIVLDEAHNIKNRKTKAAIACCALEGKYRWCLTGTPMQNNVEELYSLLQFLRIRPLNDWSTFNEQINIPIKKNRPARAIKRLHVVLKAVMLRRKKDSMVDGKVLIELPPRNLDLVECDFDEDERAFYDALNAKIQLTLNKFINNGSVMSNYTSMLVLLLRLRQACNHPSLVSKSFTEDKEAVEPKGTEEGKDIDEADELADLLGEMGVTAIARKCQMCQVVLPSSESDSTYCSDCSDLAVKARRKSYSKPNDASSLPPMSAKIGKLLEILEDIDERSNGEEKTIVFSQFTSMLDIVQKFLKNDGVKFVRYDGSMRKDQRERALDEIKNNDNIKVILISFKAGSTGLNLTACNNVVLVDMWWNPALEDQAFDRAHRFGQTRAVNIFKLTVKGTVEDRILELQDKKRTLAAAALSGDKMKNNKLGMDDLLALFRPGAGKDDDED